MIFPNKNTDPNLSIINCIFHIVTLLNTAGQSTIREAKDYLASQAGEDILPLFEPSLDVLYLLGKLEYNPDMDAIFMLKETGE